MTIEKPKEAGVAVKTVPQVTAAPIVHSEPKQGGSYVRNLLTGDLGRVSPQVVAPVQE